MLHSSQATQAYDASKGKKDFPAILPRLTAISPASLAPTTADIEAAAIAALGGAHRISKARSSPASRAYPRPNSRALFSTSTGR